MLDHGSRQEFCLTIENLAWPWLTDTPACSQLGTATAAADKAECWKPLNVENKRVYGPTILDLNLSSFASLVLIWMEEKETFKQCLNLTNHY